MASWQEMLNGYLMANIVKQRDTDLSLIPSHGMGLILADSFFFPTKALDEGSLFTS